MNVYVSGSAIGYMSWLDKPVHTKDMTKADLVLFTGGEDIHPKLYNEPVGKYTSFNTERDKREQVDFEWATRLKKPMLGICRGSQFVCAMSGGRLIQHMSHPSHHPLLTWDGRHDVEITSSHHQCQYPYDMPKDQYKLIAWADRLSPMHLDGNNMEISKQPFKEPEIVYYPKTRALGIQGHPEWLTPFHKHKPTFDFLGGLIKQLLTNQL